MESQRQIETQAGRRAGRQTGRQRKRQDILTRKLYFTRIVVYVQSKPVQQLVLREQRVRCKERGRQTDRQTDTDR